MVNSPIDVVSAKDLQALPAADVVINCAAVRRPPSGYTQMPGSGSWRYQDYFTVNAVGAGNVALWARAHKAYLIHVSCDSVMGSQGPYYDVENPYPQDDLSYSKLLGEMNVQALAGEHTIVRTGWMYGAAYVGCYPVVAATRKEPNIDDVERGQQVHANEIAKKIMRLVALWAEGNPRTGILHVTTNQKPRTWYDYLVPHYPHIEPSLPPGYNRFRNVYGLFPSTGDWIADDGINVFKAEMDAQAR